MAGIRKRNWNGVHRRAAGISLACLLAAAAMVTGSCGKKPEPEPTSEPVPATTEGTTKDAILAPPVPTTPAETEPAKDPDEVPESGDPVNRSISRRSAMISPGATGST